MMRVCTMLLVLLALLAHSESSLAQSAKSFRIAYLALIPGEDKNLMRSFTQRLRELGWVDGQNIVITYLSADGKPDRLPALAAELVKAQPHVIVAGLGTLPAKAAKEATSTIPVVFVAVGDPLGSGIVLTLNRPEGNVTGMSTQISDLGGIRLQLIGDIAPGKAPVAVLRNPQTPLTALGLREIKQAAERQSIYISDYEATTPQDVGKQFSAAAAAGARAVIVLEDPLLFSVQKSLPEWIRRDRLPTLFGDRSFVQAGGLMSYGPDRKDIYRRAGDYVDKVLKGAKPGELAVEQPTKFELVLNLNTAKTISVDVPDRLLALADEVID